MKNKILMQINGIIGIVGGIFLILSVFFFASSAFKDISRSISTLSYSTTSSSTTASLFILLKILILILGIAGLVYYKTDKRITGTPNILLIISGFIAFIPYCSFIGGIIAIVGGGIALSKLKYFNEQNFNN